MPGTAMDTVQRDRLYTGQQLTMSVTAMDTVQ